MDIRPIRDDDDHAATLAEIERLWGAEAGTAEGDKLDVLATLAEAYEDERWPLATPDPVDILDFAISEMGRSQAELGRLIGRSRASEILRRKRPLTLQMVQILHEQWHIPAEVLIKRYPLRAAENVDRAQDTPASAPRRESRARSGQAGSSRKSQRAH